MIKVNFLELKLIINAYRLTDIAIVKTDAVIIKTE